MGANVPKIGKEIKWSRAVSHLLFIDKHLHIFSSLCLLFGFICCIFTVSKSFSFRFTSAGIIQAPEGSGLVPVSRSAGQHLVSREIEAPNPDRN